MNKILLWLFALLLSGCSSLCPDVDELAEAGVCADPFYIDKNLKNIYKISYPNLDYKEGRFINKDEKEDEDEN